jgi:hypothetical protein
MDRGESPGLAAVQRRLRRLVVDPDGVEAALAAEGDAQGAKLAALVRADRGLAPAARLAVYANAYFARIHDCLRGDFPALARALGPAAFHDLVKTYLMMHPPDRPSLRHAGRHLAGHLGTEPFAGIFARRCAYAADLARLEWAMVGAFDAPDAPVLARETLGTLAPAAWSDLRFETAPSLALLDCAWPVHGVRERFERDEEAAWDEAPELVGSPTHLRVWRIDERVAYRAITRVERDALHAVRDGESFGTLCARLDAVLGEGEAPARAAAFLASWLSDGLLVRLC